MYLVVVTVSPYALRQADARTATQDTGGQTPRVIGGRDRRDKTNTKHKLTAQPLEVKQEKWTETGVRAVIVYESP